MPNLQALFCQHPESVGESYLQHLVCASRFAGSLFVAACVCFVHALLPFMFEKTGSQLIKRLHEQMVVGRVRGAEEAVG